MNLKKISIQLLLSSILPVAVFANDCVMCKTTDGATFNKNLEQISTILGKTTLKDGFYLTNYNLKIDAECAQRMKISDLENFYRKTMLEGTACIDKLTNTNFGSKENPNSTCFQKLFADKDNPPKLLCGGWPFGKDVWAVGSFPGSSKRHPYLWLGPEMSNLSKSNPSELKAIIFHEMLHNCGHTHSEGIEITYTCEQCCFADEISEDLRKSACNICGGKYSDENDPNYIKDLLKWAKVRSRWRQDMLQRVFLTAKRSQNKETFKLILEDINLVSSEQQALIKLFENQNPQQKKELLNEFRYKFKTNIDANTHLKSLLEWIER